jgi:ABC-type glutathione transport system ATPase component
VKKERRMRISVIGQSGAGKSTVGAALAAAPGTSLPRRDRLGGMVRAAERRSRGRLRWANVAALAPFRELYCDTTVAPFATALA